MTPADKLRAIAESFADCPDSDQVAWWMESHPDVNLTAGDVRTLRALLAERQADAADAARYRWVKSRMRVTTESDGFVMEWWLNWGYPGTVARDIDAPKPSVDEVVDELLAKLPEPPRGGE